MKTTLLVVGGLLGIIGCDSPPEGCRVPDPDKCDLSKVDVAAVCENDPDGATTPYLCPAGLTPDDSRSCSAPYYGVMCDWGSVGVSCCD